MGIHIKLGRTRYKRVGYSAFAVGRLAYMEEILHYFEESELFVIRNMEAWKNADNEPMGGTLLWESPDVYWKLKELKESWIKGRFYRDEWFDSVIIVKGSFNIKGKYYSGYISANNDELWRQMYMDLTIDSFGAGEKGDLTLLLLEEGFTSHVKNFIERIARKEIDPFIYVSEIYWGVGPKGFGDVDGVYAMHVANWGRLVRYMIENMSQEEDPVYKKQIEPLREAFFSKSLMSVKEVKDFSDTFLKEEEILAISGGSITYVSEEEGAFRRFYEKFKEGILVKAAKKLPNREDLEEKITGGIREGLGLIQTKLK